MFEEIIRHQGERERETDRQQRFLTSLNKERKHFYD